MKSVIIIILIIALPLAIFAQEYTLTLKSTKLPIQCEVLGVYNGHLYYKTPDVAMTVIPLSSVIALYQGTVNLTADLILGSSFPLTPNALALFPTDNRQNTLEINQMLNNKKQSEELRGIKTAVQIIAVVSVFTLGFSIYDRTKSKPKPISPQ